MNAIPSSRPENAIIKARGNRPRKKKINPEFIILYVNPLNILRSIWPLSILAANLKPSDTFLAKYEINSINTNKGSSPSGHPEGTKREKNLSPCLLNPKIVAPKTIVKLNEKVSMKWLVGAKL